MTSLSPIRRAVQVVAVAAAVVGGAPASAEPSVTILPLPFEVREFRGPGSRVAAVAPSLADLREDRSFADSPLVVVWGSGGGAALTLAGRDVRVQPLGRSFGDLPATERGREAIPASRVESAGPITVSLTEPTRDYVHAALGEGAHAKTVSVVERRPVQAGAGVQAVPTDVSRVAAGQEAVFEDREPRLVQLTKGAVPEIVTVKSYAGRGSALAVLGKREGGWRVVAETPPVGEAQRWLNPAASADFLDVGSPQVALVRTPHADGVLQIWRFDGDRLTLAGEKAGYSNHAFGQTAQDLAAVVDLDGDGRPELALPSLDRRSLAVLSWKGGMREILRIPLPARAETGVAALGAGPNLHIFVGLEDGRVADIRP